MYISIESILLREFVTDFLALLITLTGTVKLHLLRIILASAIGAIMTCAVMLTSHAAFLEYALILPTAIIMLLISSSPSKFRHLFSYLCRLLAVSGLFSAAIKIIPFGFPICAALAILIIILKSSSPSDIHNICRDWQIDIVHNGVSFRTIGIIDTGNRVREPISGLPVMIISNKYLNGLDLPSAETVFPDKHFRIIPFGSLGGNGSMACFMPDRIMLSFKKKSIPLRNMWVAVYSGSLPGGHGALLPPETINFL